MCWVINRLWLCNSLSLPLADQLLQTRPKLHERPSLTSMLLGLLYTSHFSVCVVNTPIFNADRFVSRFLIQNDFNSALSHVLSCCTLENIKFYADFGVPSCFRWWYHFLLALPGLMILSRGHHSGPLFQVARRSVVGPARLVLA